jgi:hypothetical protein
VYDENEYRHAGGLDEFAGFLFRQITYSRYDVALKMI